MEEKERKKWNRKPMKEKKKERKLKLEEEKG